MNPEITAETIKQWLPGTFPGDMEIEPVEITDELSTGRMVIDKRHLHPGGYVHGGAWTAFGDSVAAWATFRALPPNHDFTTIELKLNVFAAGALGDELICEARPLHVGRSTAVSEAKIRKGEKPVANLIVTQFVLPGRELMFLRRPNVPVATRRVPAARRRPDLRVQPENRRRRRPSWRGRRRPRRRA